MVRAEATAPTAGADCDVYVVGTVFQDIVFTGLDGAPAKGAESWARGMGCSPGGVANTATALARLGLRTVLCAAFGDDEYGDHCWADLAAEGVDLSLARRPAGWHSPVTVSFAYEGDRTMVTHGHEVPAEEQLPPPVPPCSRACVTGLAPGQEAGWVRRAAAQGSLVFADAGWDATGRWALSDLDGLDHCHAFVPNAAEALRYTRTDDARAAARALAEVVPVAVVTAGEQGAVACDGRTGDEAAVPAVPVDALDPTGAGDVFLSGFVFATLADWPLADCLAFANLCAALSVAEFGGAHSAPGWHEINRWWSGLRGADPRCRHDAELLDRYDFLTASTKTAPRTPPRRAVPTIGFRGAAPSPAGRR
ncbi:carbohydrate kinase family protein [Streptomyces cinerochromogenes]|uniref:Carbohydrate kinase family protein n=1 Tax=Streptomyces cinerochromogenes TaxID=66422 RepID=A0ABW7BEJ7_9ACTN